MTTGKAASGPFRIGLFGQIRVLAGEEVIARLPPGKRGVLLGFLAVHHDRGHVREELIERFWPEVEPVAGHNRLKQTLSELRRSLTEQHEACGALLAADRQQIALNADRVAGTDVADFEAALRSAALARSGPDRIARLAGAVKLYRGDFIAGSYDDWVLGERERLAHAYAEALVQIVDALERIGEPERALHYARLAVQADPWREEAHRAILRSLGALGRRPEVLRHYLEMERRFLRELGARPSAEATALFESAKREESSGTLRGSGRAAGVTAAATTTPPEPVGGAMPLESRYYIVRPTDAAFTAALARQDSIVLVKGPRQVGKTSLLVRGADEARASGARVVSTDLQKLNKAQLDTIEGFYLACARSIADPLGLEVAPEATWDARRGANDNFERFLRRNVLGGAGERLVWCIDEVDRLFGCPFRDEVFGLFRSWHNERALDPSGPWSRLTLAIAYATEAHLFISDLNQSPFNVGTRLTLEDFTLEQFAELNRRYGGPLGGLEEIVRLFRFVGGSPYLSQRSLHEMTTARRSLDDFIAVAERDDGPFHDHLRRILSLLSQDGGALGDAVRLLLYGAAVPPADALYRLRSAGIITGDTPGDARMRCELYARYLSEHLR